MSLSFFLPQHDINEATDETEREGHPGQDIGVAELRASTVIWTHHGVDDGPAHHEHTSQDLEDGCEEEASTLHQFEELVHEGDEGEEAEKQGQDHEGLHRLDPIFIARRLAVVASIGCCAAVPQICASTRTYIPRTCCCRHYEQNEDDEVQDEHTEQNEQHFVK